MLNKATISEDKKKLIVDILLIIVTFAVYWQVNQFDFINFDDNIYVSENTATQSGLTLDGIRWAFGTKYFGLWNPLVWFSLMFDYQLYGLNAGGYHLTNLILHVLSALLLFWLFHRMTGALWPSAFVAAFFALHPLHVESVAWIAERKDVLSAFFWMLTLYLYVFYIEKPAIKRYLLVLCSFVLALMSKPMVVTLPAIMILLDYWPLKRFESKKENPFLWQMKEKLPFFILSAIVVIITLYNPNQSADPDSKLIPLTSRLANAPVAFISYLIKTFWPYDMAIYYPVLNHLPWWQILGLTLIILIVSTFVIAMMRRLPYLFVGWSWYALTIAPVIGIIQIGPHLTADRYHYLPSLGIAAGIAWGVSSLIKREKMRRNILYPTAIAFLAVMSVISWQQCRYWKNSIELWNHAIKVTGENDLPYYNLGCAFQEKGRNTEAIENFKKALQFKPNKPSIHNNLGTALLNTGDVISAAKEFQQTIRLNPNHAGAHNNLAMILYDQKQFDSSRNHFQQAVKLQPNFANAHYRLALISAREKLYEEAFSHYNNAVRINPVYGTGNYQADFFQLTK
ncbi:MAG: tetratricopeptide repeat protein [Smithella sp.]